MRAMDPDIHILRAAVHRLYLSDNHFFKFGVKITSVATEHTVVIIDAGSRGLDPDLWTKAQINAKIMNCLLYTSDAADE